MQYAGNNRYNATCKVCYDAGNRHLCNTHKPKGEVFHQGKGDVFQAGWPIIKEFGQVSLCPVLQNTVCTNPQCFNGQNGVIRFSCFGHSISHCPCKWPQGWEIGGPMEHMRYTGYTPEQWSQIQYNTQSQLTNLSLLPISPLVRQTACSPIPSPVPSSEENTTSTITLEIQKEQISLPIPLENPETQKEVMELKEKTKLLTQEVEILRKKLQEKQEQSSRKQPDMNWAEEMCDS